MNMSEWLSSQARAFREENNQLGLRMFGCLSRAYEARESDPDLAIAACAEGKQIAEQLREPWWVLFYETRRIEALMQFKRDFRNVLDFGVQCVAELSKPTNATYPGRAAVWDNLIAAYCEIDPEGYEEQLQQAIEYLDKEIPQEHDSSRYLLQDRRILFAEECDRPRDIYDACMRQLDFAASDSDQSRAIHFAVFTYCSLCPLAARIKDWETLASWSAAAEELARLKGHRCEHSEALAWQGVAAFQQGDEEKANRTYLNASTQMSHLRMPPKRNYYEALAAYHLHRGDLAAALGVRDTEWKTITGWGRLLYECRVQIQRAWLLLYLGRLQEADLVSAREAAGKLRKPAKHLEEIEAITAKWNSGAAPGRTSVE
jgi:hypothetical protein